MLMAQKFPVAKGILTMPCRIDAENVSEQVKAVSTPDDPADVIDEYVSQDYGWDKIVQEFTTGVKDCKEREFCGPAVDKATLAYIGAVRKRIVMNAFDCFKRPGQALQAAGSTTLTSDFDVCVLGRDACFTMWLMFKHFQCTYKTTLPTAFDNNLYANGTYGPENLKVRLPGFEAVPLKSKDVAGNAMDVVALFPDDAAAEKMQSWATVKVLDGLLKNKNRELGLLPFLDAATQDAAQDKLMQASTIDTAAAEIMERLRGHDCGGEGTEVMETLYALQFYFARRLNILMYGDPHPDFSASPFTSANADPAKVQAYMNKAAKFDEALAPVVDSFDHDLADVLSLCMFFSVEAAYTQSTVNVVVLEMQAKAIARGGCVPGDYRTTLVEVLGDFLVHFPKGPDPASPAKVLKLSKYVYRLVYAAGEMHDRDDWRLWADAIKERVVSKRGETDAAMTSEDWDLVRFSSGMTCFDYRKAVIVLFNELYGKVSAQSGGRGSQPFAAWAALTAVTLFSALVPR
jgi:hypothetical protein